jgi:hypothetical protein
VRADLVIILSPMLGSLSSVLDIKKGVGVEQFIADTTVK